MATKIKAPAQPAWVAQSQDEAAAGIRKIGDAQRRLIRLETLMNDEIAEITGQHQPVIDKVKAEIAELQNGVQIFCEANRTRLTDGNKTKSANLTTGNIIWRQKPPAVQVKGVDSVIEHLKTRGLNRFLRVKEELNKPAMLNEPEIASAVPGVKIITGVEEFSIEPFEQTAD